MRYKKIYRRYNKRNKNNPKWKPKMTKKTILLLTMSKALLALTFTSQYTNLEINSKTCDKLLHKSAFDICYSYKNKTPSVTIYSINKTNLLKPKLKRKHLTFKPDYQIPIKYRSYSQDYSKTGFDRGHNTPNAAFNYNKKFQKETFLMSNISPQKPKMNRGIWRKIEKFARFQAMKHKKVNIITGSCLSIGKIKNNITIPKYFFKIIQIPNNIISFLVPNKNFKTKQKAKNFLSSIKEIEQTCKDTIKFNIKDKK